MEEAGSAQQMISVIKAAESRAGSVVDRAAREAEDRRKAAAAKTREIIEQAQRDLQKKSAAILERAQREADGELGKEAVNNERQRQALRTKAESNMEKAIEFILDRVAGARG